MTFATRKVRDDSVRDVADVGLRRSSFKISEVFAATLHRLRAIEFRKFLDTIDAAVPTDRYVHLVLDNNRSSQNWPKAVRLKQTVDEILASIAGFANPPLPHGNDLFRNTESGD